MDKSKAIELIAELERLEKLATKGPWQAGLDPANPEMLTAGIDENDCYCYVGNGYSDEVDNKFIALLRTHARELLTAAKLSEKLPKYADTGEAFVPGRDEAWIAWHNVAFRCQIQKFRWAEKIQEWFCYVTENGCDGSSRFYSTREAALAARRDARMIGDNQ